MRQANPTGFTLVELLVTVSIIAVILGLGAPSVGAMIKDQRLSSVVTSISNEIYMARSESAKSGGMVTVCARLTDTQCGTDWNNGMLVFRDSSFTSTESQASRDTDDEIIRVVKPYPSTVKLVATGSTDGKASGAFTANYLRFKPNGRSSWKAGTFHVCDDRGNVYAQALKVTKSGDVKVARYSERGNGTAVQDIFGRAVSCT